MAIFYKSSDGTKWVPEDIYERDENNVKNRKMEKIILEGAKNDPAYKDAKHKPFIRAFRDNGFDRRVLMLPATEEEYQAYLESVKEEDRQRKEEEYNNRCLISDGKGKIKQCPVRIPNPEYGIVPGAPKTIKNDCEHCPIHRQGWDLPRFMSIDAMLENSDGKAIDRPEFAAKEQEDRSEMQKQVVKCILDQVINEDHRLRPIVELMLSENISVSEACNRLEINASGVYKGFQSKKMIDSVMKAVKTLGIDSVEEMEVLC